MIATATFVFGIALFVTSLSDGLAAGAFGAAIGGVETGDTSTIPETVGWSVGFAALAALLGFGIGLIARQSAAAISGLSPVTSALSFAGYATLALAIGIIVAHRSDP